MIITLMIREIRSLVISLKFLICLVVMIVCTNAITFYNIINYEQYNQDSIEARSDLNHYHAIRTPNVLCMFAQGYEQKLGRLVKFSEQSAPVKTTNYYGTDDSVSSQFMIGFSTIDFAFIVGAIISLLTIFMTFNIISGEKYNGTLRLILSNNVPRDVVLIGKALGGFSMMLFCFITSFFVMITIALIHPSVQFDSMDLLRIILMIGISIIYIALFYLICLLVSVNFNQPPISLMVLLQIWLLIVVLIPLVGVYLADRLIELPSREEILIESNQAARPYVNNGNRYYDEYRQTNNGKNMYNEDNKLLKKHVDEYKKAAEAKYQVKHKYMNLLTRQAILATNISSISPVVLYNKMMQSLAGTGLDSFERFMDNVYHYWKENLQFTLNKKERKEMLKTLSKFKNSPTHISLSFYSIMFNFFIMLIECVIFFILSYITFLKKDVR